MFNNILNSAKNAMDAMAEAAQQPNQQQQQPQQPVQPQQPPQQQQQAQGSGGNDFLTGLMNVAQEVGKAIGDKSQEGAQAVKSGANTVADTTKTTAEGAGRMTKEEIDRLASGIGDLVGKAAGAFSHRADVEEEVTSVDSQGGKVQISSVQDKHDESKPKEQQTDFFAGLVGVAKQMGQAIGEKSQEGAHAVKTGASNVADTTKTTAEGAGRFTKEEIDKFALGIGALVGKATESFGQKSGDVEEEVKSVDSQGGKVQVSSVHDAPLTDVKPKAGGDFFAGLVDVAKQVGQAIGDKSHEGAQAVKSGASNVADSTKSTAEGAGKITKEEIDRIASGIGELVGKFTHKGDVEEQVAAVDSQGGKVQVSSVQDNQPAQKQGGDFFAGLVDVAKQVGQAIGDKSHEGAQAVKSGASNVADTTKTTAEGAGKMTKEEMDKLSSGISDLFGKAAGAISQIGEKKKEGSPEAPKTEGPAPEGKPAEGADFFSGLVGMAKEFGKQVGDQKKPETHDFTASKPEVDDIEGEIGKVVTAGYTSEQKAVQPTAEEAGLAVILKSVAESGFQKMKEGAPKTQDATSAVIYAIREEGGEAVCIVSQDLGPMYEEPTSSKTEGKDTMMGELSEEAILHDKEADDVFEVFKKEAGLLLETAKEMGDELKAGAEEAFDSKKNARAVPEGACDFGDTMKESAGDAFDSCKEKVGEVLGQTRKSSEDEEAGLAVILKSVAESGFKKIKDDVQKAQDAASAVIYAVRNEGGEAVCVVSRDLGPVYEEPTSSNTDGETTMGELWEDNEEAKEDMDEMITKSAGDAFDTCKERLEEVQEGTMDSGNQHRETEEADLAVILKSVAESGMKKIKDDFKKAQDAASAVIYAIRKEGGEAVCVVNKAFGPVYEEPTSSTAETFKDMDDKLMDVADAFGIRREKSPFDCMMDSEGFLFGGTKERAGKSKMDTEFKSYNLDEPQMTTLEGHEEHAESTSCFGTDTSQETLMADPVVAIVEPCEDAVCEKKEVCNICPACEVREGLFDEKSKIPIRIKSPEDIVVEQNAKARAIEKTDSEEEEEGEVLPKRGLRAPMRGFRSRSPSASSSRIVSSSAGGVQETNLMMDVSLDRRPVNGGASVSIAPRLFIK